MKRKNTLMAGLACLLLFWVTEASVLAAEGMAITEHVTTGQELVLYVKGAPEQWDEAAYQIGTTSATIAGTQTVSRAEEPLYTLILWDNSLSVMKKYGEDIKSILTDVVANRAANEKFALATIDEKVVFQTDYTDDYTVLKEKISGIEGEDKDAYIIENVYEAVLSLKEIGDCGYKRILLISDGMDATEIGYSRGELEELLSETPYPIYTIGVLSKDRQDELQDMFALSRTTHADYFYVNETEDLMTIVRGFSADYSLLQVKITVPAEQQDGSTQNSQLTFVSGSDTYVATSSVRMPFASSGGEETAGDVPVQEKEDIALEVTADGEEQNLSEDKNAEWLSAPWVLPAGIGVLVLLLVLIVVVVLVCRKKKKPAGGNDYARLDQQIRNERYGMTPPKPSQPVHAAAPAAVQTAASQAMVQGTQIMGQAGQENRKTQFLFSGAGQGASAHKITLTSTQDAVKSYQYSFSEHLIIGRNPAGAGLVIDDNAVSGRHCEIGLSGSTFYAKDLGSSNGTFINGTQIRPQVMTEIKTGCILRLGREDYRITVE